MAGWGIKITPYIPGDEPLELARVQAAWNDNLYFHQTESSGNIFAFMSITRIAVGALRNISYREERFIDYSNSHGFVRR